MKKNLLMLAAVLTALVACDKEPNGDGNGTPAENPDPTKISAFYVASTDVVADPDGFNMITDGGFENFIGDENWKSKSLFYLPEHISEAEAAYSGQRSIFANCDGEGWWDACVQTVALKKNKDYTITMSYVAAWEDANVYFGLRGLTPADVNTNKAENHFEGTSNAVWNTYSFTSNSGDNTKTDSFVGGWGWYGFWLECDDVKVVPTGSTNDSFMPKNAAVVTTDIINASYNEVTSAEKVVLWKESDGKLAGMLYNAKVGDNQLHNAYFTANNDLKVLSVAAESATNTALIPTAGVTVNGTKYVHFYEYAGESTPGAEDDAETFVPDWTAAGSVVYSSTDGAAWTATSLAWPAESKFIKAAYVQNGNYVYMFGTPAGDNGRETYVARVAVADFGTLSAYEYWAGEEWVADETLAVAIMFGPTDCMSVVYDAENYTYKMIYRSATAGQLVYRDAGLPEGEWSGEKLMLADPNADTQLFAPQAYDVTGGKIKFVASKK